MLTEKQHEAYIKIRDYYENVDDELRKNSRISHFTDFGIFAPSNTENVRNALDSLFAEKVLNEKQIFCDAGCGDARIIALTEGVYNMPSFGIEGDKRKFQDASYYLNRLKNQNILNGNTPKIIQGDFTKETSYNQLGIKFTDIEVFYNYYDNFTFIAEKIAKESKKGTKFLLYHFSNQTEDLTGLSFQEQLILNSPKNKNGYSERAYLQVYRK
jgi:hypothetical protein